MRIGDGDCRSCPRAATVGAILVMTIGLTVSCAGGERPSITVDDTTITSSVEVATSAGPTSAVATTEVPSTAPTRPLAVGEAARVGDLDLKVTRTSIANAINNGIQGGTFLLVEVEIRNLGTRDESYGPLDWSVILGDGRVVEPEVYADEGKLAFGSLGSGESAGGVVAFTIADREPVDVRYEHGARPSSASATWAVTPGAAPGA